MRGSRQVKVRWQVGSSGQWQTGKAGRCVGRVVAGKVWVGEAAAVKRGGVQKQKGDRW